MGPQNCISRFHNFSYCSPILMSDTSMSLWLNSLIFCIKTFYLREDQNFSLSSSNIFFSISDGDLVYCEIFLRNPKDPYCFRTHRSSMVVGSWVRARIMLRKCFPCEMPPPDELGPLRPLLPSERYPLSMSWNREPPGELELPTRRASPSLQYPWPMSDSQKSRYD